MMPASDAVGVGNTFFKVENRSPDKNWDAKAYSTCALGPDMPTGTARSTKKQRLQPTEEVREMSIKTGCQQKELAIIIQNIRPPQKDGSLPLEAPPRWGQTKRSTRSSMHGTQPWYLCCRAGWWSHSFITGIPGAVPAGFALT
ncbi:hypothetical protein ACKKBG_A09470 [Auxenochlorella protothecoides x Auxenochlorella symbiontica]